MPAQTAVEGCVDHVTFGLVGKQLTHDLFRQVPIELHRQQFAEYAAWAVAANTRCGACDSRRCTAIVERAIADKTLDGRIDCRLGISALGEAGPHLSLGQLAGGEPAKCAQVGAGR